MAHTVDGIAVGCHPAAYASGYFGFLGADVALAVRAEVDHQVAVEGIGLDGHFYQVVRRFDVGQRPVAVVAPLVFGDGHHTVPVVAAGFGKRGGQVAFKALVVVVYQVAVGIFVAFAVLVGAEAAADNESGVHGAQFFAEGVHPGGFLHPGAVPGAVEPEAFDLRVVGEEFHQLVAGEGLERFIAGLVFFPGDGGVSGPVQPVVGGDRRPCLIARMVPVDDGEVEVDVDAFGGVGLHNLFDDVLPVGRVRNGVVRVRAWPHAEAVMVLGGEYDVAGAHLPGLSGPSPGVEPRGVELLVEVIVFLRADQSRCTKPFGGMMGCFPVPLSAGNGVHAPVDELSQAVFAPALHVGVGAFAGAVRSVFEGDADGLSGGLGDALRGRQHAQQEDEQEKEGGKGVDCFHNNNVFKGLCIH